MRKTAVAVSRKLCQESLSQQKRDLLDTLSLPQSIQKSRPMHPEDLKNQHIAKNPKLASHHSSEIIAFLNYK